MSLLLMTYLFIAASSHSGITKAKVDYQMLKAKEIYNENKKHTSVYIKNL